MAHKKTRVIQEEIGAYLKSVNGEYDPIPQVSEVPKSLFSRAQVVLVNGKERILTNEGFFRPRNVAKIPGNYVCETEGVGGIACGGMRCIAHVITRQDAAIRAVHENRLYICKNHETWWNKQDVKLWYRYIRENHPAKFSMVRKRYDFIVGEYKTFMEVADEVG